jgi:iron complex transport system ATP-binding protein
MNRPIIEVQGLTFSYGKREVLRNVSLRVERGEYLSVIGPNGAGKTTLLKCLLRILRGAGGTIRFGDKDLERYRQRDLAKRMGYVPQGNGLEVPFTVHEFVMMGRYPYLGPFSSPKAADTAAVARALRLTDMGDFSDRYLRTLSGGERQKVLIAAALAQEPEVLLLDEPTTFLDPYHQAEVAGILKRLHREAGVCILSVTHDINHAALSSQRILALKDGAVEFLGPSEKIMHNDILERVYGKPFVFASHPVTGRDYVVPE